MTISNDQYKLMLGLTVLALILSMQVLAMFRLKIRREPGLGLGIILIDGLLTLKLGMASFLSALLMLLFQQVDGREARWWINITLFYLLAQSGWILFRVVRFWQQMRVDGERERRQQDLNAALSEPGWNGEPE